MRCIGEEYRSWAECEKAAADQSGERSGARRDPCVVIAQSRDLTGSRRLDPARKRGGSRVFGSGVSCNIAPTAVAKRPDLTGVPRAVDLR
ncbi:hypothetical protein HAX54_024538 [Datura stramonium]|uniref:Uncharacterized protein n=1 Tax=Datura stramonium TaxID=4076 RepID=A0ABS8S5T4_DATST|nr:hypothetical protein [Datura stramonium]